MTFQHLNFEQLSDLLDDEVTTELKQHFLQHIAECESCRDEYDRLNRCLCLVRGMKIEKVVIPDICGQTINLYYKRKNRRILYRTIPAIAASLMLIAGAAFISSTYITPASETIIAEADMPENETQVIISSIRDAEGRIIRMTGSYIEGTVNSSDFARLERMLKGNNIKYTLVSNGEHPASTRNTIRYLEDVDYKIGIRGEPLHRPAPSNRSVIDKNSVTVRIFR